MLPKFLFADNYEITGKVFIVRTQAPRVIFECSVDDFNEENVAHWIDAKPTDADLIKKVLKEAEEYYKDEFSYMEQMMNEEDN